MTAVLRIMFAVTGVGEVYCSQIYYNIVLNKPPKKSNNEFRFPLFKFCFFYVNSTTTTRSYNFGSYYWTKS